MHWDDLRQFVVNVGADEYERFWYVGDVAGGNGGIGAEAGQCLSAAADGKRFGAKDLSDYRCTD